MIKELFENHVFVLFLGILVPCVVFKIQQWLKPVSLDEKLVKYKDVKKLLAENDDDEKEKFDLIIMAAKTQVQSEIRAGVSQLVLENGALVNQFISEHQTNITVLELAMKKHSERLDEGGRIIDRLRDEVEKLSGAFLKHIVPPASGKILMDMKR